MSWITAETTPVTLVIMLFSPYWKYNTSILTSNFPSHGDSLILELRLHSTETHACLRTHYHSSVTGFPWIEVALSTAVSWRFACQSEVKKMTLNQPLWAGAGYWRAIHGMEDGFSHIVGHIIITGWWMIWNTFKM